MNWEHRFRCLILAIASIFLLNGCAIIDEFMGKDIERSADELMYEGVRNMERGRYTAATENFQAIKDRYPYSKYAVEAELRMGDMLYMAGGGRIQRVSATFEDDDHLMRIIERIVAPLGRRIDEGAPMVDARLPDGSRVNAIIPPLSMDGPMLSIRRFAADPLELEDLIKFKTLTPGIGEILKGVVKARLNVIISGGTGSGKTTTAKSVLRILPEPPSKITGGSILLKGRDILSMKKNEMEKIWKY